MSTQASSRSETGIGARARPTLVDVYDPLTAVDLHLSTPSTIRFFDGHASADQPWVPEVDTAIHFLDVSAIRPIIHRRQCCVVALSPRFKRTIVSVRYASRLLCGVYYAYKPVEFSDDPEMEVVLLLHPAPARRGTWTATMRTNRPLHSVIEQTLDLLKRSANLRVTVVGCDSWNVKWFDGTTWGVTDSDLTIAHLWAYGIARAQVNLTRLSFVPMGYFQHQEPELFRLSTTL